MSETRMKSADRVAVVTGGAQGIGRRTAELLSERGYRLAIIDLQEPRTTVRAIEARGGEVLWFAGDITREEVVEEFAQKVFERFERVDVLVNNAGISLIRPAEDTSPGE